jgi:cation-transporting ATPase 13A3/4/5
MSTDGEVPLAADGTRSDSEEEAGGDDEGINHRGRRRRRSISPTFNRSSVFENIANLFSRGTGERRSSLSRRSSASSTRKSRRRSSDAGSEFAHADEVNERWGYSSGEEDDETESDGSHPLNPFHNEIDYGSYPPSPSAGSHLPLFAADAIFGDEVRIDIDIPQEPLNPPPPGPPSRQTIYVPEEDNTFRFVGYEVIIWRQWLWRLCCAATLGVVGLLGHWFPRIWLRCVVEEKAFRDIKHGCVVVESSHRDITLFPVKRLAYPYARSTVFPVSPAEADGRPQVLPLGDNGERQEILDDLHVVDYRYSRFALDVHTGLFCMIRNWRDPTWTGLQSIQNGLPQSVRHQRLILFGPNIVDIEGKSTISLLVDEIIHPFYVFQVASIILWSLDDYYYYAFCIALISTLSVVTTLIDTKKVKK